MSPDSGQLVAFRSRLRHNCSLTTSLGTAMFSSTLCQLAHAELVSGVCPWCKRQISFGQPRHGHQDLKQRILTKLRDKIDGALVKEHNEVVRDELRRVVRRMCTERAVLGSEDLEGLVEEILAEFLGQP